MLGKRTPPVIGKPPELLVSCNRSKVIDISTSPRSPLDFKTRSPRGLKNYDLGKVGLGIVAALEEKAGDCASGEILAKYALANSNSHRSDPIPVKNNRGNSRRSCERYDESLENYTIVTFHRPNNKSVTKVYLDGHGEERRHGSSSNNRSSVFNISPMKSRDEVSGFPASDFLSSCHLCRKRLQGKDIYMYRGEKGFCSTECRYRQIVMDERKEHCRSEASRSAVEVSSSSSYSADHILSTTILAI
ncbi:Zf-FLZ domain [Dillenia turbinata]|uniref:Zf-FLZ domain n=1 Tax=Dillenia turbinata TaxID=194707 RepID=A0AAN8ZKF0_9MAGN